MLQYRRLFGIVVGASVFASGCGLPALLEMRRERRRAEKAERAETAERALDTARHDNVDTRCKVRRSAHSPLVVEWPAVDRAALEARATQGLVVVRYSGCEIEVLPRCTAPGAYEDVAIAPKRERVSIRDADELYTRLPVGAARLEGQLAQQRALVVDMTVAGRKQAPHARVEFGQLEGACGGATHVLSSLVVGAFSLYAVDEAEEHAEARLGGAAAGRSSIAASEIIATDGTVEACHSVETGTLRYGCSALLGVEATPLFAGTIEIGQANSAEAPRYVPPTANVREVAQVTIGLSCAPDDVVRLVELGKRTRIEFSAGGNQHVVWLQAVRNYSRWLSHISYERDGLVVFTDDGLGRGARRRITNPDCSLHIDLAIKVVEKVARPDAGLGAEVGETDSPMREAGRVVRDQGRPAGRTTVDDEDQN